MNCDQVFDILTRGPFPTGTPCDLGVESHLARCPECRRLAEALRPALELFQEAIAPEESRDLPGYWCATAADPQLPQVSYAQETRLRHVPSRAWAPPSLAGHWSAVTVWRMAAMLALGVTLGSLVGSRVTFDGRPTEPPSAGRGAAMMAADDDPQPLTVAQRTELAVLPAACSRHRPGKGPRYSVRSDQLLATADLANLDCCSECHNANSDSVPSAATVKVSQHCQVCHNERAAR